MSLFSEDFQLQINAAMSDKLHELVLDLEFHDRIYRHHMEGQNSLTKDNLLYIRKGIVADIQALERELGYTNLTR